MSASILPAGDLYDCLRTAQVSTISTVPLGSCDTSCVALVNMSHFALGGPEMAVASHNGKRRDRRARTKEEGAIS